MPAPLPAPPPSDHGSERRGEPGTGPRGVPGSGTDRRTGLGGTYGGTAGGDARRLSGLARAAAGGDRAAATLLVQYTYRPVWQLVSGLVPADGELVEDLVQETYARAFQRLPELPADQPVLLWLLRLARRLAGPHRSELPDDAVSSDDPASTADRATEDALGNDDTLGTDDEGAGDPGAGGGRRRGGRMQADVSDRIVLQDAVARLDPEKRVAFVLTQILGLSYDEAAQVCGCPIGTIRSRVARARHALIEVLTPPAVTPVARSLA